MNEIEHEKAVDRIAVKCTYIDILLEATKNFDSDDEISGADFVEWFSSYRAALKRALAKIDNK